MDRNERIAGFTEAIWEWYAVHKRSLPWRDMDIHNNTERAYRVMVSEIMLQQTQVSRVKIVFRNFLETFPSMNDLAKASNAEVIMAWRGMGYNSRALRLRDAARFIVTNCRVQVAGSHVDFFPREMNQLLAIPGLGPYTAAAIRNFAFNIPTPCIDTNIRRILHRTFVGPEASDGAWAMGDRELLKIAQEVLEVAVRKKSEIRNPKSETNLNNEMRKLKNISSFEFRASSFYCNTADWHAALMDYGSLVQTKNNPKWDICILTERGLMKATTKNWNPAIRGAAKEKMKKEPGRLVGSTYIPNRIFRGKIVEALRDAKNPMLAEEIGRQVCIDWQVEHHDWLLGLLVKLEADKLIARRAGAYKLA